MMKTKSKSNTKRNNFIKSLKSGKYNKIVMIIITVVVLIGIGINIPVFAEPSVNRITEGSGDVKKDKQLSAAIDNKNSRKETRQSLLRIAQKKIDRFNDNRESTAVAVCDNETAHVFIDLGCDQIAMGTPGYASCQNKYLKIRDDCINAEMKKNRW